MRNTTGALGGEGIPSPFAAALCTPTPVEGNDIRWFAVCCHRNQETRAERELERQGFITFLPKRMRTIRHARKTMTAPAPLFPQYLFVELDPDRHRWRSIDSTYGVMHLVRFTDRPSPVPKGVVEALRKASDGTGLVNFDHLLEPGHPVRVAAGPFADRIGMITRLDGRDAVRVLLEMMGRSVEVRARRSILLPV